MELRSILGKNLTSREKAKLNERCVLELQKELKSAQNLISQNVWEISNLKKECSKKAWISLSQAWSQGVA